MKWPGKWMAVNDPDDWWKAKVRACGGCRYFVDGACELYGYDRRALFLLVFRFGAFNKKKGGVMKVCLKKRVLGEESF